MFEHIGRELDPAHRRRTALATALAGSAAMATPVVVWVGAFAVGVLSQVASMLVPPPEAPPPIELTGADIEMIEIVMDDSVDELTDADIPLAPPPPPEPEKSEPEQEPEKSEPEPEPEPAPEPEPEPEGQDVDRPELESEPVAIASDTEEMAAEVKEPEDPEDDAVADADMGESEPSDEEAEKAASEEARKARQERLAALSDARTEGLLALGDLGFDRKELDPGYTDGRRWDGVFGPRDSHVLISALRDGTVDELKGREGGYTMSMSSFGMGFLGMGRPMRLPPSRTLVEAAEPRYPKKLRREFRNIDCELIVTVDATGHAVGLKVRDCPEPLHELAFEAAHQSLWEGGADGSEASVKHVVEFRDPKSLEPVP